jgi:hypothetical protein
MSQHISLVFGELQQYDAFTGSFINYYVPNGFGGVITCSRAGGFYHLRLPQEVYFEGEVLITTNGWTDGTYTPSQGGFMADYYEEGGPKDLQSHWDLMGDSGFHQMSIEYREHRDITIWADGKVPTGRTPLLVYRWEDLFRPVTHKHKIAEPF